MDSRNTWIIRSRLIVVLSVALAANPGCDANKPSPSPAAPPPPTTERTEPEPSHPVAAAPVALDPHAEVKKLIEERFAKYEPVKGKAVIGLAFPPGTKALVTNDAGDITGVDLSCTPTNDADLEQIATLPAVETLLLSHTRITDAGIAHLKKMPKLKKLTIYWTEVSDTSIKDLKELSALEDLGIGSTKVTEEGMKILKEGLPGCKVR